ncbi:MAG: hypothetical protein ACK2TW_09185 [Anaerolineales bacterium]|jgi:hypothetical protein
MDYGNVLSRAWRITWRWKILWVLGFLAGLGSGGGGGSPGNINYSADSGDFNQFPWKTTLSDIYPGFENLAWDQIWPTVAVVVALIVCVLLLIAIALWVVSVIARGGLIAGVQQVEDDGSTSFRSAWRAGRKKFWTLFGVGVLASIPMIILGLFLLGTLIFGIVTMVNTSQSPDLGSVPIILSSIVIIFLLLCCVLIPLALVLEQIRVYGERAAILEDLGWIDSFKRGWKVLKENLGHTVIFWLIYFALGIGLLIVSFVLILGVSLPFLFGFILMEPQTWMIAPAVCVGLVFFIGFILVKSIITTFVSAGWTLAYREMTMLETGEPEPDSEPLESES